LVAVDRAAQERTANRVARSCRYLNLFRGAYVYRKIQGKISPVVFLVTDLIDFGRISLLSGYPNICPVHVSRGVFGPEEKVCGAGEFC